MVSALKKIKRGHVTESRVRRFQEGLFGKRKTELSSECHDAAVHSKMHGLGVPGRGSSEAKGLGQVRALRAGPVSWVRGCGPGSG